MFVQVTSGSVFLKKGRFSSSVRIYSISEDLGTLFWRNLEGKKSDCTFSVAFKSFESVTFNENINYRNSSDNNTNNNDMIVLDGHRGSKSLRLRYVGALNEAANRVQQSQWGQILRLAVAKANLK